MREERASHVIQIAVWSLAGLIVVLALAVGVTAATLPGCTLCHQSSEFVTQTSKSAHPKVACVRCHVQPGAVPRVEYAYHLVFGMALHITPTGGPAAAVPDSVCLPCHEQVTKKIVKSNGISIKHSDCAKGRSCTDCHSDTAHGTAVKWATVSTMNMCLDCHDATRVRADCTTCHSGRSIEQRLNTGEWQVTHGSNWKQAHGMGDLKTCASCHPGDFCVKCHGIPLPHGTEFLKLHPAYAASNRESCAVCHKQTFCDNCHGLPMPHPDGFTPTHPAIVKKQGSALCLRCHIQDDCTNCHIKHIHPGGATLPPGTGGLP